jgi:hypothetical protein
VRRALFLAVLLLTLAGVGAVILRDARPEDLPWKPLTLDQPAGLATGYKLARLDSDLPRCLAILQAGGIRFRVDPDRPLGACPTSGVVRLQAGMLSLEPGGPRMTCRQALAYSLWTRHSVRAAAEAELGEPIARIDHYGTFACRNIAGSGARSQHATANALDVAGFRTRSGRRITIARDFGDPGAKGRFLHRVRDGACPWFRAVLSPDYNAAHRDHLHLDRGRYDTCA